MDKEKIQLAHGSGGTLSYELVNDLFLPAFENKALNDLEDSARLGINGKMLAFSTDSYTVKPLFFPGGDIGRLSICGTVNDLSMVGAKPLYISISLIIEEGLPIKILRDVVDSIKEAAARTRVKIVTGDTKVVEVGGCDRLFINTAGIGLIPDGVDISVKNARPGDLILLSGTIGDHGMAVLSQREGFKFESEVKSDCAPLNDLVASMLKATKNIHVLRDPTRGGLASTLNEIAIQSGVELKIDEEAIPIREDVKGSCEMLGLDPLSIANEGKLVAIAAKEDAEDLLKVMRNDPLGKDSAIIGEVINDTHARVILNTKIGGNRILNMPSGELLPRIC